MIDPLIILGIALVVILGMILFLRVNAFIALITAAMIVSFLAAGPEETMWVGKITRVTQEFGNMAGRIGLLIVMGAIIGKCMMHSGAADRIVFSIVRLLGEKQVPASLMSAGFVISVPVFYDTALYLLIPLARTFYRKTRKNYILLLTAIGAGATLTHNLIPPTPGPLITAKQLDVSIGAVMLTGSLVAMCIAPLAFLACKLANWSLPNPTISDRDDRDSDRDINAKDAEARLPSLWASVMPIVVPVVLITGGSVWNMLESAGLLGIEPISGFGILIRNLILCGGDPTIALSLAAFLAAMVMKRQNKLNSQEFSAPIESAIIDAGLIVMITAAGGAFGAMLRTANIGERISELFKTDAGLSGVGIILLAFGLTSLIKLAQGSSTTAMITSSSIIGTLSLTPEMLGFHPAYLATTIGLGSIVTAWMNDSGFWVFCRMGGINEIDALKTWSLVLAFIGCSGLLVVLVLTRILPLQ